MRFWVTVAFILPLAAFASKPDPDSQAPGHDPNMRDYAAHTFGAGGVVRSMVGAGITQGTNTPSEWHQGMAGFGRRFASAFGKHIVKKTIEFPIAKWRHEPFMYRPSYKTGVKARIWYAVSDVVITHRTTDGKPVFHSAELGGAMGSGFISRLWQPASTATIGDGFVSGGLTLLADAGGNIIHEFWPEIRHPHSHLKARAQREEKLRNKEEAKVLAKAHKREEAPVEIAEQDREEDE